MFGPRPAVLLRDADLRPPTSATRAEGPWSMQFLTKYAASVGRRAKEERIRVQMWLSEHLRRRHFASDAMESRRTGAKHNINLVRADLGHVPAAHSHGRHRIENAGAARHFRYLGTAGHCGDCLSDRQPDCRRMHS